MKVLISSGEADGTTTLETGNVERILVPILNSANMEKALEFAVLIKENRAKFTISILSRIPNYAEAETNIASARRRLEDFHSKPGYALSE